MEQEHGHKHSSGRHHRQPSEEQKQVWDQEGGAQPAEGAQQPNLTPEQDAADLASLRTALEECKAQGTSYFDGWQRERADFANFRRRVERDQQQMQQNALGGVLKKYLVISDDLSRALKNRPTMGDAAAWADGIELIYRKLQQLIDSEGIQRMDAEGQQFDPNRHEAISHEASPDHESGQIIEVIQDGYLLGDRVLRPALVRVAR